MRPMAISFPGGVAVEADYKGFRILTDQSLEQGGSGNAPSPFDLFVAALGTCAGFYALRFCQERQISTAGLGLSLALEGGAHGLAAVTFELRLPAGFPDKYRDAIVRAVGQCTVKRQLEAPPRFVVNVLTSPRTAETSPEPRA